MRFISWNVNGLRACLNKGFLDTFRALDADFFCLQETKLQAGQIQLDLPGYHQYWCYAEKKGYSGTAIFTRHEPLSVSYGLGIGELDTEGRVICLEYPEFYLVTCYTPNAQRGLARIGHRLRWEEAFRDYLCKLDQDRPVVICGDLNVAHKEIDLKNPSSNRGNAGFSDEERAAFSALLDCGFTDTFRHLHPDKTGAYSWWSYMFNARQNNAGWRIDYFVVSDRLKDQIYAAQIHPEFLGSDHCPVALDLDITCNGGLYIPVPEHTSKTENEADGDSPIGSGLIWKATVLTAILALLIAIPALFLSGNSSTPEPTSPTVHQVVAGNDQGIILISEVIDRTGIVQYINDTPSIISSSMRQYLVCNERRWELEGHLLGDTEDLQSHNYHIQIIFDPSKRFSSDNKPQIGLVDSDLTAMERSTQTVRYYLEDGYIAGCFISGYARQPFGLQLLVSWNELSELTGQLTITPSEDDELFHGIHELSDFSFAMDTPILSAYSPSVWLTCGEERWRILHETQKGGLLIYPSFDFTASYALRIEFQKTARFTSELKPLIGAQLTPKDPTPSVYEKEDLWTRVLYYVDDDDRVAGAFIFAYASTDATLQVFGQHNSTSVEHDLYLDTDMSHLSALSLAKLLVNSQELRFYIDQGGDYLPTLLDESPALRELISRPDFIDIMIYVNSSTSVGSNFDALLALEYFDAQMNDSQRTLFQSQQERGIIYGIYDGDLIFSESILRSDLPG